MRHLTLSILVTLAVLLGSAGEGWSLPKCSTGIFGRDSWEHQKSWDNCVGTWAQRGGSKFVGEYKDGMWHGQGTLTYANGDKYVGEFKDGMWHGQGTWTFGSKGFRAGEKYVGEWKLDKRHGQGTETLGNGDKYVGEFKNGERHGQGTFTYPDGRVKEGIWEGGSFKFAKKTSPTVTAKKSPLPSKSGTSGTGVGSLPPCSGIYKANTWTNCEGTYTSSRGDKYVGEFKDGSYHGQGTETSADGRVKKGIWKNHKFLYAKKPSSTVIAEKTQPPKPKVDQQKRLELARRTQEALEVLGLYSGKPDGIIGVKTKSAIQRWQKRNGYSGTGEVIERQLAKLEQEATTHLAKKKSEPKVATKKTPKPSPPPSKTGTSGSKEEATRRKAEAEKKKKARLAAKASTDTKKGEAKSTLKERIATLKDLKEAGLLSEEEFQANKRAVLNEFLGLSGSSTAASKKVVPTLKAKPSKYADVKFGKYYALVIGNNDYKHLPKLKTAAKDAKAVAKTLRDTFGFEVKTLINATRSQILDAFDDYQGKLVKSDNLLLYYAGHGWLDKEQEQGYWLPVNAKSNRRSQWISNSTITDTLKSFRAKHVMVVADSCFSGTLTRGLKVEKRIADYVREVVGKKARVALTSGGLEPVEDGGGGKNSPFATAFLKVLNGAGEVLTGTDLFKRVKRPVQVNADQTPNYADIRKAGHDGGDFLFVRKK